MGVSMNCHTKNSVPSVIRSGPARLFPISVRGSNICGVVIGSRLVLTISDCIQNDKDFKRAKDSEVPLQRILYNFDVAKLVFIDANCELEVLPEFMCKEHLVGEKLHIGAGSEVTVVRANRQRLYYDSRENSDLPGTPLYWSGKVVGFHEKPGSGVTLVWVYRLLLGKDLDLPPEIREFRKSITSTMNVSPADIISQVYTVFEGQLISYDPVSRDFFIHACGLPTSTKICYVAAGLLLTGSLKGSSPSSQVWLFDAQTGFLAPRTDMKMRRIRHCVVNRGENVYCIGGSEDGSKPISDCEVHSVSSQRWSDAQSLPEARMDAGGVEFKGKIYVIGGVGAQGAPIASVAVYSGESWSSLQPSIPICAGPAVIDRDQTCVWIAEQTLSRWSPETSEVMKVTTKNESWKDGRIVNSSFYAFSGSGGVFEAMLENTPIAWSNKVDIRL